MRAWTAFLAPAGPSILAFASAILLGSSALVHAAEQGQPVAATSVRVQQTPGGPQIHVDGRPIPPRFFFGSMNSGVLHTRAE